jgi:hypothetical protein
MVGSPSHIKDLVAAPEETLSVVAGQEDVRVPQITHPS